MKRVQFDRNAARVFKSNAYMPFPLTLRMRRYVAFDSQDSVVAEKHRRTHELKEQVAKIRASLSKLEQVNDDKASEQNPF